MRKIIRALRKARNHTRSTMRIQATLRQQWRKNFESKKKAEERIAERKRFLGEQKERLEKTRQIQALAKSCGAHASGINPIETRTLEQAKQIAGEYLMRKQHKPSRGKRALTSRDAEVLGTAIGELQQLEGTIASRIAKAGEIRKWFVSYSGKKKAIREIEELKSLCIQTIQALENQQGQARKSNQRIREVLDDYRQQRFK